MKEIQIGSSLIGASHPPYLVAELSANHNGSLERALEIIKQAHRSGAHAIKLQTYTADTLTLNSSNDEFFIHDRKSLWKNRNLYELYQEASTPYEWHSTLFQYGRELGIEVFSSPFSEESVDFLETLNCPCYKIASPEIVNLPLIQKAAKTGKPLILSTGAANLIEIAEAIFTAKQNGCQQILLLKCTAAYPAQSKDAHLSTISHLARTFRTPVGISDHTLGIGVAIASVALGGCLIEKHFTLSRNDGGVDSAFSMEPQEFAILSLEAKRAWEAMGEVHYGCLESEAVTYSHRPSLYFVETLPKGTVVQKQHVRIVRPGKGLPPKELSKIIGLTLTKDVVNGTPVSWNVFQVSHED